MMVKGIRPILDKTRDIKMVPRRMASPLLRSNIVIFFISMSLVLTLAVGVYASNRLLSHRLLTRGLEQAVQSKIGTIQALLKQPAPAISGLRLTSQPDTLPSTTAGTDADNAISSEDLETLKKLIRTEGGETLVADAVISLPGAAGTIGNWYENGLLTSAGTLRKAQAALDSTSYAIVPDMSLKGTFGRNGVIALRLDENNPAGPRLLVLAAQSKVLSNLAPLILSISASIGILCLASFVISGLLLWLRFRDQVKTNSDIQFLAHHDALTGLPNRAVFNARLAEALRLAQAKASNIGVMLIDVDKFKEINDTHGHGVGDVFLQIVGERLKMNFDGHLVARLSGDEFAVLITSISDPGRMTRLASDMIAATESPCFIDGREIKLSLSIGIARATDGSWRATRLLHCADLALYRAKHSGRATFSWYTPGLDAEAQKRKEVEAGLTKALKFDQFKLLYQPQYSLRDGQLVGYEALIRWDHPVKGRIKPDVFIPVAEDTGLIVEIGNWVLNRACREAALWGDQNRRIAVNVSPAQFIAGETQKRVRRAIQETGLNPRRLEIEITESLLISNTQAVIETLREIRDMGVSIAMDDFGTGYSSLSYLSLFPFDKIKIDQSFIHNLGKDASTDAIVTSIIGLGRSLDVTITAEGVETEEQAILLSAAGCDLVQGFMFGKPDSVSKHEARYPVFPHNPSGGLWFPQFREGASAPKITLSPQLARSARPVALPEPGTPEAGPQQAQGSY